MKKLYMIRHGITEGNEKRWYYGAADLPLSEAGKQMCAAEGKRWQLPQDTQFATTGMLRTEQTLEIMFGSHDHRKFPQMREMEMGEFECKTYYDLVDNPAYQAWLNDSTGDFPIPGGESNNAFRGRVMEGFKALMTDPTDTAMLVCHGGTICTVMLNLFPDAKSGFFDWHCEPCHGYSVDFENGLPVRFEAC